MNSINVLPMLGLTSSYGSQASSGNSILSLLGSLFGGISGQQQQQDPYADLFGGATYGADPYAALYQQQDPYDTLYLDNFEQDPYAAYYQQQEDPYAAFYQQQDPYANLYAQQQFAPPRPSNPLEMVLPILTSVLQIVMALIPGMQGGFYRSPEIPEDRIIMIDDGYYGQDVQDNQAVDWSTIFGL